MTMDIKTYNMIAPEGLAVFPPAMYRINQTDKPDALLIRSQDMHKTHFGTSVLAIARAGAGVNNIPLVEASSNGTVVFNTPGSNANAVKELIVAMLVIATRPIFHRLLGLENSMVRMLVYKRKRVRIILQAQS